MTDSGQPPSSRLPVILIVDDEEDVRNLVLEILRSAGFLALTAPSGEEALTIVQRLSGRTDLLLTDVMMPGLDGRTLALRLAKDWPTLPVLFMTGYPEETLAALGMLPVEVPRIEKPFRIRELVAKVRSAARPSLQGPEQSNG